MAESGADTVSEGTLLERPRMCLPCRSGHHVACDLRVTFQGVEQTCPCHKCHPEPPARCGSCGGFINPLTGECRCSD